MTREHLQGKESVRTRLPLRRGTEVSPVGIIGYYYPATVYVAENGMLYCVHEYESDVRVFADVEEILAYELQVHRPIRIERRR